MLPTSEQARERERFRAAPSLLGCLLAAACMCIVRSFVQTGRQAGGTAAVQISSSPTPAVLTRCAEGVPNSIECGDNLVPAVLCQPALDSHMLTRYAKTRSSPWHGTVRVHGRGNSLRLFQYSWSPPAFGTGNSWEATRVHLLAAALLSRSDVVCLQGLSGEQAHWLKDAFDMQGYDSIISATPTALADLSNSALTHTPDQTHQTPPPSGGKSTHSSVATLYVLMEPLPAEGR